MVRKKEFVTALQKNKRKGWVRLGFSANAGGMASRDDVVNYLDEAQQEWQNSYPSYTPTDLRDEIKRVVHLGIGGVYWYGFRYFYPMRKTNLLK